MPSFVTAIGTANPPHRVTQNGFADFYADQVGFDEVERRKLKAFYQRMQIANRYSVLPDYDTGTRGTPAILNGKGEHPAASVSRRMELFQEHAAGLAAEAVGECLARAGGVEPAQVDHLITVSSTGLHAPGLDVDLIEKLGFRTHVERTAINFMGCFAAINALRVADSLCRARPDLRVLIVNVELPSLHFRPLRDAEHLVSNALFGDGASAMLVEGHAPDHPALELSGFGSDIALRGRNDMLWRIRDDGFEVRLSAYIPVIVKGDVGRVVDRLLASMELRLEDMGYFAFHPGGRAILEAIEAQVGISARDNRFAYEILRDYGNMSSCTLVFVLERILSSITPADAGRKVLGCSFGPGLTLEALVMEVSQVGSRPGSGPGSGVERRPGIPDEAEVSPRAAG